MWFRFWLVPICYFLWPKQFSFVSQLTMIKSCQNSRWHFFAVLWFSIEVDKYKMNSWFECQKVQHTFPVFQGVYPQNIWTNNLLRFGCPIISRQRKICIANCKYVLIVIFQNYKVSLNNIKRLVLVLVLDLVLASKPSWKRIAALLVLSVSAQMMKWPLM